MVTAKVQKLKLIDSAIVCGTISSYHKNKSRKQIQIKLYYAVAVPKLLYGSET